MNAALPSTTAAFDLSKDAAETVVSGRRTRYALAATSVALFAVGVYFVSPLSPQPGNARWIATGALWAVAVMLAVSVVALGRSNPIRRIEVGESGLAIEYESGTRTAYAWDDPNLALTITDYSALMAWRGPVVFTASLALDERRPIPMIPGTVVREITARARRHDVPVLVRPELVPGPHGPRRVEVLRVGDPERTPGWKDARLPP